MRSVDRDLTAEARIRQAALARFPRDGFEGTTIRALAEDADVSPGLILHHFGSKQGLREACDHFVVQRLRQIKEEAIAQGGTQDANFLATAYQASTPLVMYLSWALVNGHPAAADLFDEMLEESIRLMGMAEEAGLVRPSENPRARAAVLLSMQLGGLVLHEHLSRAVGTDVLSLEGTLAFSQVALEILTHGVFIDTADATAQALREAERNLGKEDDR